MGLRAGVTRCAAVRLLPRSCEQGPGVVHGHQSSAQVHTGLYVRPYLLSTTTILNCDADLSTQLSNVL